MKSLAERHTDRAQRLVDNATELTGTTSGSVASAEAAFRAAHEARARLTPEEQARLDEALDGVEDDFDNRSLAEAPDGSGRTMAGVGVINTEVVPAAVLAKAPAGNGSGSKGDAGWGTPPVTEAAPKAGTKVDGNLNGAALADQGAGGGKAADASKDEGGDKK
jgi:hypothetical protein